METDSNARNFGMLCHLLSLIGYFSILGFIVAPLALWMVKRKDHPFIDDQGRESVNFQITIFLLLVVSLLLTEVEMTIGAVLLAIVAIYHLIFTVVASVRASRGLLYRYPLAFRFLK